MKHSKQTGTAALLGLGIMIVLLTLTMGVTGLTVGAMRRADRDIMSSIAYQAAQAAVEEEITYAMQNLATPEAQYTSNSGNYAIQTLASQEGQFKSTSRNVTSTLSSIANGCTATATVMPVETDPTSAFVTSVVNYRGINKSVRVFLSSRDVSIWNNAVFAGTGAAGRSINGNVGIAGSVHILGDGELYSDLNGNGRWDAAEAFVDTNKNGVWDPGEAFTDTNHDGVWSAQEPYNDTNENGTYDPPLTTTDLSSDLTGTGTIMNNYSIMPVALEGQVPAAPRINTIETLSAELRVKNGLVALSGSAQVGTSSVVDGGTSKGMIDGVYVSDGWGGNKGALNVFSDNGSSNTYDLESLDITFPTISGIGAQKYVDTAGTEWTDQAEFYDNRTLYCPKYNLTSATSAFSYGPDAYGNRISFVPKTSTTPATLICYGVVKFPTDNPLQIGAKDDPIRYVGNGTLYSTRSIYVDGDFLPASGTRFPTDNRMGLVSKRNMYLASGSGSAQLSMAGAFYAQGRVTSLKQNQIAGTFVANFFDMGTNVPKIYQVPSLVYNMPPAMPGDKNYYSIRVRSWRDRYIAPDGH